MARYCGPARRNRELSRGHEAIRLLNSAGNINDRSSYDSKPPFMQQIDQVVFPAGLFDMSRRECVEVSSEASVQISDREQPNDTFGFASTTQCIVVGHDCSPTFGGGIRQNAVQYSSLPSEEARPGRSRPLKHIRRTSSALGCGLPSLPNIKPGTLNASTIYLRILGARSTSAIRSACGTRLRLPDHIQRTAQRLILLHRSSLVKPIPRQSRDLVRMRGASLSLPIVLQLQTPG
jgi:hypothetical protein